MEKTFRDEYYQGILQLRDPSEEIIEFIRNDAKKQRSEVFISKETTVDNGIDFYISNNKYLRSLEKKLKSIFGGISKTSPTLFTMDKLKSKRVYRLTVVFRCLDFIKGDVLKADQMFIKVSNIGKMISGTNIKTNKKVSFDLKKIKYSKLDIKKTMISKIRPQLEVLDPETFDSIKVSNTGNYKLGEKVRVVIDTGVWLV